mgnify:CR=1 FL=1
MIQVKDLEKEFSDFTLFKDVSFEINQGEFVGLVGHSGIGKSTLLYMISGLKESDAGQIIINNHKIHTMSPQELLVLRHNNFGFIFQENYLINYLKVRENILLPVKKFSPEIEERMMELAHFFGISHQLDKFPGELSVGQKQRVSIARALINAPHILFADEPTASLDDENSEKVISLLKQLNQKEDLTIFMVSHDKRQWQYFDRIIELKDKTAVEIRVEDDEYHG